MAMGSTDYDSIIAMIKHYEEKNERKMKLTELVKHIQEARKIKLELAKQYVKDLAEMHKIIINDRDVELC